MREIPGRGSFGSGGSLSRCPLACPGYLIALGYRANGGTCTLFWLSRNYFEETLGLRDGTLGLIEGMPLKGSPRKSNRRPQAL